MAIKKKKKIVKKAAKKTAKKISKKLPRKSAKKVVKKIPIRKPIAQKPIGVVTHFFGHIRVAIVKFSQPVKVGVALQFKGATTDFEDRVQSMQYEHASIAVAPKGKQVGIKVKKKVREGDRVFLGRK